MKPVIVVHGGAGRIFKEREQGCRTGVIRAALQGYSILKQGGSALDAVEEAVRSMEDNPHFNAGNFSRSKLAYNQCVRSLFCPDHSENTGLLSLWSKYWCQQVVFISIIKEHSMCHSFL